MAAQKDDNPPAKQTESELFAAFPEPQGWALKWDGAALQAPPKNGTSGSKPKQPRA
jgi:hypothetical protein